MAASSDKEFTARQREVLRFLAAGYTNWDIALALGISLDGAKWHVREVMSLLHVDSREDAAAYWRSRNSGPARLRRMLSAPWSVAARILAASVVAVSVVAIGVTLWTLRQADDSVAVPTPDHTASVASPTATVATASATTFVFLGSSLDLHPQKPANPSFAESAVSLRAFAGDALCARISLVDPAARDADGNARLVVGLPDQPPACRVLGATVLFGTSNGTEMFVQGTVGPGTTVRVQNLAPAPPGSSPGFAAEETIVFFPLPNFLGPSGEPDPEDITVFANGQRCMRVARGDGDWVREGYIAVPLGRPGQPAACSRSGAPLSAYDQDGNQLGASDSPSKLAPLTWMYMSGIADPTAQKKPVSELGPIDSAWP